MKRSRVAALAALGILGIALAAGPAAGHGEPTCAGALGSDIVVHGQHVVGDYVTGLGGLSGGLEWPPAGQVGEAMRANKGAALPGGPGPGLHFTIGFAPGASFCTGAHPNGFTVPAPHAP